MFLSSPTHEFLLFEDKRLGFQMISNQDYIQLEWGNTLYICVYVSFLVLGGYLYNLNHGSPSIVLLLCKVISRTLISLNLTYSIVDKWKQNTEVESLKLHGKCNLGIVL